MEGENYNPLHVNKELIYNCRNEVIEKLFKNKIKNWECPICYENSDNIPICFPYKCYHINCIECLKKNCKIIVSRNKYPTKELKCPICRAGVNINWIKGKIIYESKFYFQNKIINLHEIL